MSSEDKIQLVGALYNWTDDLPVCKQSGVGYQINRNYRAAGTGGEDYQDRSFHFQCPDDCYLYGIIDGHGGFKVPNFVMQKLPAELLLGQLKNEYDENDVTKKLQEAFENVQKGFVDDLINEYLVEKMTLEEQVPQGMNEAEALRRFPSFFQHIEELDAQIAGGCSVVIGLIHKSKLYIANVGDARAVLCRIGESSHELVVTQLSVDHTINSSQELGRLDRIGLDIENLQISGLLKITRSIGDWNFKGGYKSNPLLSSSIEEPIPSIPSIHGGEILNTSMQFLFFMSQGVYNAYQKATNTLDAQVNYDIAVMIHEEISKQTTIEAVSQSVVDKICRLHRDQYVKTQYQECIKRDDMTLLVRLINIKLGSTLLLSTSEPPVIQKKIPNLAPIIIPTPPPRPPKPKELSFNPLEEYELNSFSPPPSGRRQSTPSPLKVTVTGNPNYWEIEDKDALIQVPRHNNYMSGNITRPATTAHGDGQIEHQPDEISPVFRGFTEEEQRNFFQGPAAPGQTTPPLLAATRKKSKLTDSTRASNDSTTSTGSIEDKTKLFNRPAEQIETDADGRIKAYVDFTEFTTKVNAMGGEKMVFSQFLHGNQLSFLNYR